MVDQFLRVADELGWDVRVQIEKLEAFAGLCGASARLEEELEQRGLIGSARYDLKRVRDVMLDFVTTLGNHGAMNHFLRRELRLAAEARAAADAAARDAPAVAQAPATAPAARGMVAPLVRMATSSGMNTPRIGILVCDDLEEGLQTRWPSYGALFHALFADAGTLREWRFHVGERPASVDDADVWVLTGSRADAFADTPWVAELREFTARAHRTGARLVGICFGHQIIHTALGGEVGRAAGGWGLGIYPVAAERAFAGWSPGEPLALLSVHRDQVLTPAPGLVRLAGGAFCPNYLFAGPGVVTVQGHPEFDHDFFSALLPRVSEKAGDAAARQGRQALSAVHHHDAFATLLREFARGREILAKEAS